MGELGDLLELVHDAHRRFRTLRGTLRSWHHHRRSHEAFIREHRERGGTLFALAQDESGASPPETSESWVRFWLELPDRVRAETDNPGANGRSQSLVVIDGDTWWSFDPHMGAVTNGGDPNHGHGLPFDSLFLEPAQLLGNAELELLGETAVAGRRGFAVNARPRIRSSLFPEQGFVHLSPETNLVIDAERGVLLRIRRMVDGEAHAVDEFTEIAYDEQFPAGTFRFVPPPGEALRTTAEAFGGPTAQRPLHEVATAASFTVFAARVVPPDWTLLCRYSARNERADWPESVHLFYAAEDGSVQINVNETLAAAETDSTAPDGAAWREIERSGTKYHVWEPEQDDWPMPRQVVFEREGTRIQITTAQLEEEALLAFAERFERAPIEPPAL